MDPLFLIRPPDAEPIHAAAVAPQSQTFAFLNMREAEEDYTRSGKALSEISSKNDEDDWVGAQAISRAETALEKSEVRFRHSQLKHGWEKADKWRSIFPRTADRIERTLALLSRVDWSRLRWKL